MLTLQSWLCGVVLPLGPCSTVSAQPCAGHDLRTSPSLQELHQKRAQKASDTKRLAEEELAQVKESRRVAKKKPAKPASARNGSPASSSIKANNAGEALLQVSVLWSSVWRGKEGVGRAVLTLGSCLLQAHENSLLPADASFHSVAAEPETSSLAELSPAPAQDRGVEDKLQVGLASPPGAPGTNCSAGAALEPGFASEEIQQTV